MADLAVVFHWGPDALGALTVPDLARWREKARARAEPPKGKER